MSLCNGKRTFRVRKIKIGQTCIFPLEYKLGGANQLRPVQSESFRNLRFVPQDTRQWIFIFVSPNSLPFFKAKVFDWQGAYDCYRQN